MLRKPLILPLLLAAGCAKAPANTPAESAPAEAKTEVKERPGFEDLAPAVGSDAPAPRLTSLEGQPVDLAASFKTGPSVLVFGSYS